MFSYIAFLCGKTTSWEDQALTEGHELAQQCVAELSELNDPVQFPPRLLILFTPRRYRDPHKAKQLLEGINETFEKAGYPKVPLIGGSAEWVFFDRKVHRAGALLICLASRLLKIEVAAAENVSNLSDAPNEVYEMLDRLSLQDEPGQDVNPFANRLLFALFPGFGNGRYPAPNLYKMIQEKLRARIPIFGGVTSIDDEDLVPSVTPGLQYANGMVYEDAVVAAGITSGTPLGLSFAHGLTSNDRILQVSELGPDTKTIKRFHQGPALDVIREENKHGPVVILENISSSRHSWMGKPKASEDKSLRMLREIEADAVFQVWRPEPHDMHENIARQVKNSMDRIRLENAIGCLGIRCTGYPAIAKDINLDLELELAKVEDLTHQYVGAFLAGEAGTDSLGTSYLSNWHTSTLVFGDELRDRTTFHRGFIELANFARGPALQTPDAAFDRLLRLVHEIGYPGAMISLVLHDVNGEMIIGQDALGSRYEGIVGVTRLRSDGDDILAQVLRSEAPQFVPNCKEHLPNDRVSIDPLGALSQYIIPLITFKNKVIALLQIDLGDATYKNRLHSNEKVILDALGNAVNSSLNRVFNWEQNKIVAGLDNALKDCLSEATIKRGLPRFLKMALDVFGLEMGHIRIARSGTSELTLAAGVGHYAEFAAQYRSEIDESDPSPSIKALLNPNQPFVTNDAAQDSHYQEMMKRYQRDAQWGQLFRAIGSYINMGFMSGSGERGTISLIAPSPWFFYWHHERACRALGERVGFLIDHLRRAEHEAIARLVRAKVALVAQTSHRLWELLVSLQKIQKELEEASAEVRDEKVRELSNQILRAKEEIRSRMSLAENAQDIHLQDMNLNLFIRDLLSRIFKDRRPTEAKVHVPQTLTVLIYPDLMREALKNLISNSIRAMKNVESPILEISASLDEVTGNVKLAIKDNGHGMSNDLVETLKISSRSGTATKGHDETTGWGLPITSVLLEAHGGNIEDIESQEDSGTTITIVFSQGNQEETNES